MVGERGAEDPTTDRGVVGSRRPSAHVSRGQDPEQDPDPDHDHEELLHDLRAAIAVVSLADQLLREHGDQLDSVRRAQLAASRDSGIARLARLLDQAADHVTDQLTDGPGPVAGAPRLPRTPLED